MGEFLLLFAWAYAATPSFSRSAFPTPLESGGLPSWALAITLSSVFISLIWFAALAALVSSTRQQRKSALSFPFLRSCTRCAVVIATYGYRPRLLPLLLSSRAPHHENYPSSVVTLLPPSPLTPPPLMTQQTTPHLTRRRRKCYQPTMV